MSPPNDLRDNDAPPSELSLTISKLVKVSLVILGIGAAFGLFCLVNGQVNLLPIVAGRTVTFAIATSICIFVSRWACRGLAASTNPKKAPGDFGGSLGMIAALILAGGVTNVMPAFTRPPIAPPPTDSATSPQFELEGPLFGGGQFNLKEYSGKVVIVDFWASWCRPCLAKLPELKAMHEAYHKDGLEIIGVSLDFSLEELDAYLSDNPLPWRHIIFPNSRDQGWSSPIAQKYGVDSIPRLIVVNKDGTLLVDDPIGPELESSVASALGVSGNRLKDRSPSTSTPWAVTLLWPFLAIATGVFQAPLWLILTSFPVLSLIGALLERMLYRERTARAPA